MTSPQTQRILNEVLEEALCVSDGVDPAIVNLILTMGAKIPDPDKLVKKCIDNTGNLRFLLDFLKQHFPNVYESLKSNNYFMEHALTSRFEDDDEYSNLIGYVTVLLEYDFGLKWEESPPLVNAGANTDILELLIKGGANPLDRSSEDHVNGIQSIIRYHLDWVLEMALDGITKEQLDELTSDDDNFKEAMEHFSRDAPAYEDSCVKVLLDYGFKPLDDSLMEAVSESQDPKLVEALIKAGANMVYEGESILDLCKPPGRDWFRIRERSKENFLETVRILAANGAVSKYPVTNALAGHIRDMSNFNVWAQTASFYAPRTTQGEPPLKRRRTTD